MLLAACGVMPMASPSEAVSRAIAIREQHGLQTNRVFVEATEADPRSVGRFGIPVTPVEAAEIDARQLREAIAQRTPLGLLNEEAWVRRVLADPTAVERQDGLLVSREEAFQLERRAVAATDVAVAVEAYGAEHADDWGGIYLESSGAMVVPFVDHVVEHEAAIRGLVGNAGITVKVRQARWSWAELVAFREGVSTPEFEAWLASENISPEGAGLVPPSNKVKLDVAITDDRKGVPELIIGHLGADTWLEVAVESVPGKALPKGALEVFVVDGQGRPITDGACYLAADLDGALPAGTEVYELDSQGRCRWAGNAQIGATGYRVEVWRRYEVGFIGSGRVTVRDGEMERLVIRSAGG
jgi:hypothetical protein